MLKLRSVNFGMEIGHKHIHFVRNLPLVLLVRQLKCETEVQWTNLTSWLSLTRSKFFTKIN